jgi:transposase
MTLTTADVVGRAQTGVMDDNDDPAARPRPRRSFTAAEKAAHLDAYDALPKGSEERGAYLRREGLYSSHLSEWRKQRDRAGEVGLAPKARPSKRTAEQVELDRLRRRNARLETELERTKTALEITGKVHALLESISESADTEPRSKQ